MQEAKVLLFKEKGEIFATGSKCGHYNAPLASGAFCNGRVRCPWHGACFNIRTGEIEDFPGPDSIASYKVDVKQGRVFLLASPEELNQQRIARPTCRHGDDKSRVVIVGGGAAGYACATTLREEGYKGSILMISKEAHLPYDRPKLSKAMTIEVPKILLRPEQYYRDNDIEVALNTKVERVDTDEKAVFTSNGDRINYDNVVIATGGVPRSLPGSNLRNIFQIRNPEDTQAIAALASAGARVAIIGSSFIGMEAASILSSKVASITVVGMEKVPFERVLGFRIGAAMQKIHEAKGVHFELETVVDKFIDKDGAVSAVALKNGNVIECDFCVIGAGVVCATEFISGEGVRKERDGSVLVDLQMRAKPNVYVCGDIARYNYFLTGENIRVEHWGMAQIQGSLAAKAIVGKNDECRNIPFFWTSQHNRNLRYCGHALQFDDLIVEGDPDEAKFVAYYVHKDRVTAVVSLQRDPACAVAAELLARNAMPSPRELAAAAAAGESVQLMQRLLH